MPSGTISFRTTRVKADGPSAGAPVATGTDAGTTARRVTEGEERVGATTGAWVRTDRDADAMVFSDRCPGKP